MSYSFSVRGATKAEVISKVGEELTKIAELQPSHKVDRDLSQSATAAFLEALATDDTMDVKVSIGGSISQNERGVRQISFDLSAQFETRTA